MLKIMIVALLGISAILFLIGLGMYNHKLKLKYMENNEIEVEKVDFSTKHSKTNLL